MTPPPCRWREIRTDGTAWCRSVKFVSPPTAVAADFCCACPYVDHAPCPPPAPAPLLDDLLPIRPAPARRPWDGLPPMFCITCRQTPERTAQAAQHFRALGLPVRFFPGIHGKTFGLRTVYHALPGYRMPAGHVGLVLSHYMLWQTLAFLPHDEVLVLEDDASFTADFPEQFRRAYAELPADWQFVFVGAVCMEGKPVQRLTDRVGIVRYPCGTHAYLVRRSALPLLLRTNHEARTHVDLQLIDNSLPRLRCYTFLPPLVGQHTYTKAWPTSTSVADDAAAPAAPAAPAVGPTGAWQGTGDLGHHFDAPLAAALAELFAGGSVADLGCGAGRYVRYFRERGLRADGWDGNPDTPLLEPSCRVLDLSRPAGLGAVYDWVLSLEVGEHLPPQYEGVFLDNLHRHNRRGIVLSWAVPGQGGLGHVNERPNADIRARLAALGYAADLAAEQQLRAAATCP